MNLIYFRCEGIKNPYIPIADSEICGYAAYTLSYFFGKDRFGVKHFGFAFNLRSMS